LQHLTTVFEVLRANRLYVRQDKCSFGQQRVKYLGHVIERDGVAVDLDKIQVMLAWPKPQTLKALRGFLGLTGYYRKFIQNYGTIARPLTQLLKKDAFGWNDEAEESFSRLKEAMTKAPVLALPDFSQQFIIECDASGLGIGAVLMQGKRPIAYFSQALHGRNLTLSAYEKEMLALVSSVKKWRPYLLGHRFVIRTDHRSLKFLWDQAIATEAQQKWLLKLMGYDFLIEYKKGQDNRAADALSRQTEGTLSALSAPIPHWIEPIQQEVQQNPDLIALTERIQQQELQGPWHLQNGLIYFKGRIYLNSTSPITAAILSEFHNRTHEGYQKGLKRIRSIFYWSKMKPQLRHFIKNCDVCQRHKADNTKPAGLLQPLPIPELVWSDISMDFIDGLPASYGRTTIFVVVDRLSKYGHFTPLKHPYTAAQVAQVFFETIFRLHGIPSSIVCDRDPVFTGNFWRELFRLHGTKFNFSSAYHPQTDGQTEVVNRTIEMYLRCFTSSSPRQWAKWLPWVEFCYNTGFHSATKKTPFEIVYGRSPPPLLPYTPGTTRSAAVEETLKTRDVILKEVRQQLLEAQNRMKQVYDKDHKEQEFSEGEWVYLKLHGYRQNSVQRRQHPKLAPKFYGPYRIVKQISPVAYRLALPPKAKIHDVFHVSVLKKWVGVGVPIQDDLPPVVEDRQLTPQAILDQRLQQGNPEILVYWKELSPADATWEPLSDFKLRFPTFTLEDKGHFKRGGVLRTYTRRNKTLAVNQGGG